MLVSSLVGAIAMEKWQPQQQQQPATHAPAPDHPLDYTAPDRATHAVGLEAAASVVEQKKLEAMARRAAKQKQKELEQQQQQQREQQLASVMTVPTAPSVTSAALAGQSAAPVSAAHMLVQKTAAVGANGFAPQLGTAKPVALRPNQPPPTAADVGRTNSMQRTRSVGHNVVSGGGGGAGPRVAGSIPSLQVGAGVAKAVAGSHATIASRAAGGSNGDAQVPGAAYVAGGAMAVDGVAFQSARGMKRRPDDG